MITGIVNGMLVTVVQATIDAGNVHLYLKFNVSDPSTNVFFYFREAEYDRNVSAGETVPQFIARVLGIEKPLRDTAILSYLSKSKSSIDVTAQAIGLTQP